jgi:hypothetical protein
MQETGATEKLGCWKAAYLLESWDAEYLLGSEEAGKLGRSKQKKGLRFCF